jgi:hypothetical protein
VCRFADDGRRRRRRQSGQDSVYPFHLGLMGDVGQTHNSTTTMLRMLDHNLHVILNMGDLYVTSESQNRRGRQARVLGAILLHSALNAGCLKASCTHSLPDSLTHLPSLLRVAWRWRVMILRDARGDLRCSQVIRGPVHERRRAASARVPGGAVPGAQQQPAAVGLVRKAVGARHGRGAHAARARQPRAGDGRHRRLHHAPDAVGLRLPAQLPLPGETIRQPAVQ